jgi:hypothetical protein
LLWFEHTWNRKNLGGGFVSRYRRGWDAGVKADSPDSAVDRPDSAASTRADARWAYTNWKRCAASLAIDITITNGIIAEGDAPRNPLKQ